MDDRLKILLIDDDEVDRMMARRALEASGAGAEFAEASDGRVGLQLLTGQAFDCVLLDLGLPDVDGRALLRQARAAGVATPIIVLTGQRDEGLAVELMKAGANDYLSKSRLGRDLLTHAVRHAVRLRRAQVEAERARSDAERARGLSAESEQRFRLMADSAPVLLWVSDPDGRVVYVNQGWLDFTGRTFEQELGAGWADDIHPDDREPFLAVRAAALAARQKYQAEFRLRRRDGAYRWMLASAAPRHLPDGSFAGSVTSAVDITERKAVEQERERVLAERERLLTERADLLAREQAARAGAELARAAAELSEQHYRFLAESIPQIVFTAGPDGANDYYNQRWFDYTGLGRGDSAGTGWEQVIHPDDLPAIYARWNACRDGSAPFECEYRVRRHDGHYRWHLGRSVPLRDADGQVVKWFGTCTDIDDQKHAQDALRFLAEASEVLASSLDYETTLASVARLAVPKVGDWCAVDVVDDEAGGGAVRRLAVAHTDPSKVRLAEELQDRYPPQPDAPQGLPRVLRTGQPELYADIPDDLIDQTANDAEHARLVRSLGLRSAMIVPLVARGRTIGAITFVTAESDRRYGPADLAFAEDLARRAATAVDNAQLYREAQAALRREARSAALLDTLFASSPTGLAFFDRACRYQRVNDALAAYNGIPAADHIGRTPEEVVPHLAAAIRAQVGRVVATGKPILDAETTGDTPARPGAERTWLASWYPIFDAAGEVMGVGVIATDITERKAVEEALWTANAALRESNRRYETVSRATNDAVWDWDLSTNEIDWSAGLEHLFGYPPNEVARDVQWWVDRLHPDDRARVVAGMHATVVGAAGEVWRDEYRFRRADGTWANVFDRGSVIRDAEGRPVRMIGAMADVTERRRAEQALRVSRERLDLVLGATDLGLWYCDLPLDRLEWNDKCKEHFFLSREAEVTIQTFFDRLHPDDRERTRRAIEAAIGRREPFDTDYRTVAPDGRRVRWVRAIGRAFYDPDGTPRRFDGITIDVTERRQAEEELTRAKEAAEAANAAKDQFLAVLSHELRTPLTPVLGTIQAMEDEPGLTPDMRESVEMIRRNVELEAKLIDDLLDLTRISKGKLELHVHTADAHDCLRNALDICRGDLLDKGLRLEADLSAARHHVRADAARLHQVFWNLIKNAVKFTPAGGTITVRTRNEGSGFRIQDAGSNRARPDSSSLTPEPSPLNPPRLVVEVSDTGIGVEPDVLPRIFDAFEQGERSITRQFGGLGLGLAISKALVDMQGGHLAARSAGKGKGATFAVEMATVEPKPASSPKPGADAPFGAAARPDLRILLVDDHADTAKAMAKLLSRSGYAVSVADSVGSALETFGREGARFDLLISDIGLPDGSGLELMRQIRQMQSAGGQAGNGGLPPSRRADRPLRGIALSGFGMEEDVRRSREAGFFTHLTKPVSFPQLREAIQRATEAD